VEPDEAYWRRPSDGGSLPPPGSPSTPGHPTNAPGQPASGLRDASPAASDELWAANPAATGSGNPRSGNASPAASEPAYPGLSYPGPPATFPPPSGWRPEQVVEPPPPGRLPAQDHRAIDEEEAKARTLTRGLGLLAAAILLILLCALCGRVLF